MEDPNSHDTLYHVSEYLPYSDLRNFPQVNRNLRDLSQQDRYKQLIHDKYRLIFDRIVDKLLTYMFAMIDNDYTLKCRTEKRQRCDVVFDKYTQRYGIYILDSYHYSNIFNSNPHYDKDIIINLFLHIIKERQTIDIERYVKIFNNMGNISKAESFWNKFRKQEAGPDYFVYDLKFVIDDMIREEMNT